MYPIRTVSKLTGLSLDTLRAWERRYGAVRPERTERGRSYSEADVRRLVLLSEAVSRGYAIGQVASVGDDALREMLSSSAFARERARYSTATQASGLDLQPILDSVIRFDVAALDREIAKYAAVLAPRDLAFSLVVPLLQHIGNEWERGELAISHEHLTSGALRSLLGTLVRVHSRADTRTTVLFATPSGERHEFGILIAAMLAVGAGVRCVYLGADLPASEIAAACTATSARVVVLGITGAANEEAPVIEVRRLTEQLPAAVDIWVGGHKSEGLGHELRRLRLRLFDDLAEYERALADLSPPETRF